MLAKSFLMITQPGEYMGLKLYVGNLSFSVKSEQLSEFFSDFGAVTSAKVITDRETGRSKGFGFVEFEDESAGREAIDRANGTELEGRQMKVTEALPQENKPRTGGGFNRNNRDSRGGGGSRY
jgi:RNA recognition motif-containing protein